MTHKDMYYFGDISKSTSNNYNTRLLDAKSIVRDIKLSFLTNKNELIINTSKNPILDFIIRNNLSKYVISGSVALNIYGLISRECKDLDLITTEIDMSGYDNNNYPVGYNGRLGFIDIKDRISIWNIFKREKYKCDFFLNKDVAFREFNYNGKILKIREPLSIINAKLDILENISKNYADRNWDNNGFQKHVNDITNISKVLS